MKMICTKMPGLTKTHQNFPVAYKSLPQPYVRANPPQTDLHATFTYALYKHFCRISANPAKSPTADGVQPRTTLGCISGMHQPQTPPPNPLREVGVWLPSHCTAHSYDPVYPPFGLRTDGRAEFHAMIQDHPL